ncbi:ligase-associated DNA damage response endonuclease PdeM [Aquisalimonas asiatica]|uniref:Putative phosphoesterase n=1 Tax=Aquisalimonas asiatica TaxID=406100 RepID=A0A1H8TXS6_9GAMM|nr:ligase-associated DNA damage response endonuclease PdeM [Aquisalimonas asiatica]SEO95820.1 putative phosphoesterase [Aquisalimonas asiatica]
MPDPAPWSDAPLAGAAPCDVAGERLWLLPGRALLWPRRRSLLVADPHFGKGGVFRRRGVPVPAGGTGADLQRLSSLLARTAAERLVILGDFFHGRPEAGEPWLDRFTTWRQAHDAATVTVVAGNHDRHAGAPDPAWALDWHDAPLTEPPFLLAHEPVTARDGAYVLAGHLHPVWTLGGGGDRLRVPVFWFGVGGAVLPAFGGFTGGMAVQPGRGDRLFAAGEEAVVDCGVSVR